MIGNIVLIIFDNKQNYNKKKRNTMSGTAWFLELEGAKVIIPTAFEPDPNTCRDDYYYNAITNVLYKKIASRNSNGIITAVWQKASQ